jgi:hypothetical protein
MGKKIKDPAVAPDIASFAKWLKERDIPTWEAWREIPKKERRERWHEYQQGRWGFQCWFGDACRGDDGPGHVERLLHDLAHDGTFNLEDALQRDLVEELEPQLEIALRWDPDEWQLVETPR